MYRRFKRSNESNNIPIISENDTNNSREINGETESRDVNDRKKQSSTDKDVSKECINTNTTQTISGDQMIRMAQNVVGLQRNVDMNAILDLQKSYLKMTTNTIDKQSRSHINCATEGSLSEKDGIKKLAKEDKFTKKEEFIVGLLSLVPRDPQFQSRRCKLTIDGTRWPT